MGKIVPHVAVRLSTHADFSATDPAAAPDRVARLVDDLNGTLRNNDRRDVVKPAAEYLALLPLDTQDSDDVAAVLAALHQAGHVWSFPLSLPVD